MPGGYATFAAQGGAGLRIDSEHLLFDSNASYDNGHKVNDNTANNYKGHDRGLSGTAYYRLSSAWFFGVGAEWDQLSTTNYTKASWHPMFGGGRDLFMRNCVAEGCRRDFSARLSVDYATKGSDWQNGCQGPQVTVYMPSPSAKRHILYSHTFAIYRFHDTVTDRTDPALTAEESSNHHFTATMKMSLMYRF
jgi:hypothetical protein